MATYYRLITVNVSTIHWVFNSNGGWMVKEGDTYVNQTSTSTETEVQNMSGIETISEQDYIDYVNDTVIENLSIPGSRPPQIPRP